MTSGLLPPTVHMETLLEYDYDTNDSGSGTQSPPFFYGKVCDAEVASFNKFKAENYKQNSNLDRLISKVYENTKEPTSIKALNVLNSLSSSAQIPRSKTPTSEVIINEGEIDNEHKLNPVTPNKPVESVDPLTPTANLKLLFSAISPEIRNRERMRMENLKEESDSEEEIVNIQQTKKTASRKKLVDCDSPTESELDFPESSVHTSRKEKSLGLLCQRFLDRYSEYPSPEEMTEICLDEIAKDLGVERRRIYDIVNVLESVEIVSRLAKNRYTWHGKTNLVDTLTKIKMLAEMEKFEEQIEKIRDFELSRELNPTVPARKKKPLKINDEDNLQDSKDSVRKEKSLGIMSQKFLMLFLVSQNQSVNLDIAAKILIGDPNVDKTENAKFKTKIRRLYDIANILTSLNLIRKVQVTEVRGRKPAFRYVGPSVSATKDSPVSNMLNAVDSGRPASRQSLLPAPKPGPKATLPSKRQISRHASFDQICLVAEKERNRLYFESNSQPSSPVTKSPVLPKMKSFELPSRSTHNSFEHTVLKNKSSITESVKHVVVIRNNQAKDGQKPGVSVQRMPVIRDILEGSPLNVQQSQTAGDKQKVWNLTKSQLDAVLKSLSQNGTVPKVVNMDSPRQADEKNIPLPDYNASIVKDSNPALQNVTVVLAGQRPQIIQVSANDANNVHSPVDLRVKSNKRSATELPHTGSDCYFDAKRPKREEKVFFNSPVPSSSEDQNSSNAVPNNRMPVKKLATSKSLQLEFQVSAGIQQQSPSSNNTTTAYSGSLSTPVQQQQLLKSSSIALSDSEASESSPLSSQESIQGRLYKPNTPSLHISNTSSPVMLLASTPTMTNGKGVYKSMLPTSGAQMAPPNQKTYHQRILQPSSTHSSPGVLETSTSGSTSYTTRYMVPSSNSNSQPSTIMLEESPIGIPGLSLRAVRNNIIPQSSAILNLTAQLNGDVSPSTNSNFKFLHSERHQIPSNVAPQSRLIHHSPNVTSSSNQNITPVSNRITLNSPGLPVTPSEHTQAAFHSIPGSIAYTPTSGESLLATPGSFFSNTPGGLVSAAQSASIRSAFQVVQGSAHLWDNSISTARRLELCQNDA